MNIFLLVIVSLASLVILAIVSSTYKEIQKMTPALAALKAKVENQNSVFQSAIDLFQGLAQALRDALAGGNTEDDINAIANTLDSEDSRLAAAITANTPPAANAGPTGTSTSIAPQTVVDVTPAPSTGPAASVAGQVGQGAVDAAN